jgi:ABC-type Fe3+ transport system permease subunit
MNDKEFGKALLSLETTPKPSAIDPRQMARNVVERDRRRIRLLTGVSAFFWIAATAGIVWLATMYFFMVEPRLQAYAEGRAQVEADWKDWARAGDIAARSLLVCLVALLLAALSTVVLILLSRHATLRQINASLSELTERVKPASAPNVN